MEKRKSPNAFIVVLPAYDLPRCPYEVLRMDKYDHIVCDDMFKLQNMRINI